MKLVAGDSLKKAMGDNSNPFFQIEEISAPIVSPKAVVTAPQLKETLLYDIATQRGKVYTFIAK